MRKKPMSGVWGEDKRGSENRIHEVLGTMVPIAVKPTNRKGPEGPFL